jgi:class 3 adenylate cyclase/CheY-like chemotaxis protein
MDGGVESDPPASREARNTMRRLRHAVRTPIGQIVGYSELLQEEATAAGHADWVPDLERIRQAGLGLLALVDGILGGEPAAPAAEAPALEAAAARARPGALGARLLVVDDEPSNRDLLARRLEASGYQVASEADGEGALRRVASEPFDLVLLDVLMPGMSGLEVLAALRREHSRAGLPVILATALDGSEHVVEGLRLGANDHVTKPLDFPVVLARIEAQLAVKRAADEVTRLAQHLEIRNAFIRRVFGRYVSDEVVDALLEQPEALELRGESREVTVLVADLRGFSSLTAECSPSEVLTLLNHHLGAMSEVIQAHDGIIDDFFGDGILAFFGAPVARPDHAAQAVRCAVSMQLALREVNRTLRGLGLPELEMGIGIDTGEVIVGSMGSEKRSKYGAIGLPLNLASRIESCTLGGEILISDRVLAAAQDVARLDLVREIHPKGFEVPLRVHRVVGVAGRDELQLPAVEQSLVRLPAGLPVRIALLEGKRVGDRVLDGVVRQLSVSAARIECAEPLAEMTDVRLVFPARDGAFAGACYAKVVSADPPTLMVRFTARPSRLIVDLRRYLAGLG